VSGPAEGTSLAARLWASRWPEAAWAIFAIGNLAWMLLIPSWSMLPYHLTWMSLLLLYGFGFRTWTRALFWCLLIPVMATTLLLFADPAIRGLQPYDEVIELPFMVALFCALLLHSNRRKATMAALDQVSRHNLDLLERQRIFVQNASHELRTPITVALAHAELLPRPETDPKAAEDAAIVADELSRLRRLADRLLLLATAGQSDHHRPVPTSLAAVLDDTLSRWERIPRNWQIGHQDNVTVSADPDRLVVALDAILDNAVRFTRVGDTIELSVRRGNGHADLMIADSGPGIPGDQLDSVFDRFSTPDPDRDTAHNFGLGLSIVRAIAEVHGGQATASTGPHGGAAVTLRLPLPVEPNAGASPVGPRTAHPAVEPA
jgi:two-component system, OmpR family, sensor kinase